MLFVLRVMVYCFILCCSKGYAQDNFFDSGIDYFSNDNVTPEQPKKEECLSCQFKDSKDSPAQKTTMEIPEDMKEVVKKIRKNMTATKNSIYLFISPQCKHSLDAIKELDKFRANYPQWEYEVYMLGSMKEYKTFITKNKNIFENEIPFTLDIQAKVSKKFDIKKAPTFLIQYDDVYYKVGGQPILKNVVEKLAKI